LFDAAFLHEFSCDTARKCVNFKVIIPEDHLIILELFLTTYYSKNYFGIIYACLSVLRACAAMVCWGGI